MGSRGVIEQYDKAQGGDEMSLRGLSLFNPIVEHMQVQNFDNEEREKRKPSTFSSCV